MKSERRHELQTNSLASFLSDLPLYLRFHANKLLIGVIAICLLILLIRYRTTTARQARDSVSSALVAARSGLDRLQQVDLQASNDAQRFQVRNQTSREIQSAVESILETTSDPDDASIRSEAMLAKADLNWTLASLPPLAGAATQPQLIAPQKPEEYLNNAEGSYQSVLKSYPDQVFAKSAALLGLAAIEENRGNWDKAADYYRQVQTDDKIASSFKMMASARASILPQLKQPVFLGTFPASQPATAPSTAPTSGPSTAPATTNAS